MTSGRSQMLATGNFRDCNNRRGNLEPGAEDNDGLSQRACTALAGE